MKRKNGLFTAFLCFSGLVLYAQEKGSGMLYFLTGIQHFQLTNLDKALARNGFTDTALSFGSGSGGFGKINRWRIGGEGVYFSGSNSLKGNTTKSEEGLGYFYGGYEVGKTSWKIVPAPGFGIGGLTVSPTRATNSNTIDQLLKTNTNSISLINGGTFMHSFIALERTIGSYLAITLKGIGIYNASLSGKKDWKVNEIQFPMPIRLVDSTLISRLVSG
jgi:hypothetical protein